MRKIDIAYASAEGAQRVQLAGEHAVLMQRRERLRQKLAREREHQPGLMQNLRAEIDQDLDALESFVERQIVGS